MPPRRARSRVDDEIVTQVREAMEKKGMRQCDLAEATGMTQPQISRRLSTVGPSIPIRQVVILCAGVGLDPGEVLRVATQRAQAHNEAASPQESIRDSDHKQVDAVARQLANALWNGCDDPLFIDIAIEETLSRQDSAFWDETRRRWVAEIALRELAYSVGRRYPVRDRFPLKPPKIHPEDIIS